MHLGTAKVESKVSVQASVLGRGSAVVCKTADRACRESRGIWQPSHKLN